MTLKQLLERENFQVVCEGKDMERSIDGPFCCDLLSIAMSRATPNCAWITVMANINTLAVASLTDAACIILAEGVTFDETAKKKAEEQGIPVLSTTLPIFQAALKVWEGVLEDKR